MKLAINGTAACPNPPASALLALVRSLGVTAIELWPENLSDRPGQPILDAGRCEHKNTDAAAKLCAEHGITVACMTLGFHAIPRALAQGGTHEAARALQGAVDAAEKLGAALVNCYLAGTPASLFIDAARPAAAYAAERNITIVLENEAHDDSATPEQVGAIVAAVDSPFFATQYDPCNYYHAWYEPYPAAYELLKEHIRYVHLKGGCLFRENGSEHRGSPMRNSERRIGYLPLAESAYNIMAIVRRLQRDGYGGFVTLEPHVPAAAVPEFYAKELPFLRALLESPPL